MVLAAALIAAMLFSLWANDLRKPVYNASMTYSVTPKQSSSSSSTTPVQQAIKSAESVQAYLSDLIRSNFTKKDLALTDSYLNNFHGTLSAKQIEYTNFIVLTASSSSPEDAFRAIKALEKTVPEIFENLFVVRRIGSPHPSAEPENRISVGKYTLAAAVLGALMMTAVLLFISIKRETIQTRDSARHFLDAHVIGTLYHEYRDRSFRAMLMNFFFRKGKKGIQVFAPTTSFSYVEQINSICARLEADAAEHHRKVVLITGVSENEGKTTVAGNLAAAMAMRGNKVALIDADMRKPAQNLFFDRKYQAPLPLNQLLAGEITNETLLSCIRRHDKLGLYMLFPETPDKRSTELITGDSMGKLIQKLGRMDHIIIDSPPMGPFPDAIALADIADSSILVVRQDTTPSRDLNDAVDDLRSAKAEFLGCILNDMNEGLSGHIDSRKKYGYGYYYYGDGHNRE